MSILNSMSSFLFITMRTIDVLDILLVALLLFYLYKLMRGTAAISIFFGILAIFVIWRIVKALEMDLLSTLLGAFASVGAIAIVIVFQPEIRKFLLSIGSRDTFTTGKYKYLFFKIKNDNPYLQSIDPLVQACNKMGQSYTGALIVIGRKNRLGEYKETGTYINAFISDQLIESIFYKNNPLHDGAVIINDNRIKAARCIMPVSNNMELPQDLGLRHRSAIGITERSDAVAIIVSEQTGRISYCKNGELFLDVKAAGLKSMLLEDFPPLNKK